MILYCIKNELGEFLVSKGLSIFFGNFNLEEDSNDEGTCLQCWGNSEEAETFAKEYCADVEWEAARLVVTNGKLVL